MVIKMIKKKTRAMYRKIRWYAFGLSCKLLDLFGRSKFMQRMVISSWYLFQEVFLSKLARMAYVSFDPNEDIFERVNIETCSWCNLKCNFCPFSRYKREKRIMPWDIYAKIIDELSDINYSGTIAFHIINEPFLDNMLFERLEYARKRCPEAFLLLDTNGTLLTEEKLKKALKYLDKIIIDDYRGILIKKIKKWRLSKEEMEKISFVPYKKFYPHKINSKLGDVKIPSIAKRRLPLKQFCEDPFVRMAINYDGKVLLCCEDFRGRAVIGDVRTQNLMDIWRSEKLNNIRRKLLNFDRNFFPCNICNVGV